MRPCAHDTDRYRRDLDRAAPSSEDVHAYDGGVQHVQDCATKTS